MSDFVCPEGAVLIPLRKSGTFGGYAIIDQEDFGVIWHHRWHLDRNGYAIATVWDQNTSMHRLIMKPDRHRFVDHINGNRLDNRRSNLRLCSKAENAWNSGVPKNNRTGYKGVSVSNRISKPYQVSIQRNGKQYHLGRFDDPVEAARAYDAKARELDGEFARLNFPDEN